MDVDSSLKEKSESNCESNEINQVTEVSQDLETNNANKLDDGVLQCSVEQTSKNDSDVGKFSAVYYISNSNR